MILVLLAIVVVALLVILTGIDIVEQQTAVVVQSFGKFSRVMSAGLNFHIPLIQTISEPISLKIQQLDVAVETKTKDNVFVKMNVSVQFFIKSDKVFDAFYKLTNGEEQITAYVFDVVRARVPQMELDRVFEAKDEIADAVKTELQTTFDNYGLEIVKALVTDVDPDDKVKVSMNEINAAKRLREAATERGEAEKILKVKQAEAEAESKALQGTGIANQRKAIVKGLEESVSTFEKNTGISAKDAMDLVMFTQFMDTVKEVAHESKTNSILLPYTPGGMKDMFRQITDANIVSNNLSKG